MAKIYTANDILRFIYKETNPQETTEIAQQIGVNAQLYTEYQRLKQEIGMLDELETTPSGYVLEAIMEQAKHHSSEQVH